MKLALYHGRTNPNTGGTDVEGNPVDGWGFEGPVLEGIKAVDFTYSEWQLVFESPEAMLKAQKLTGWEAGNSDEHLSMWFTNDCACILNKARNRFEYFGDMLLD